jgi:hypothetical protein
MGAGFLDELLPTFLEDSQELVGTMRRALGARDADALRRARTRSSPTPPASAP